MGDTVRRQRRRVPFAPVPRALLNDLRVSGEAVRLWGIIDEYLGDNETAWPGQETLAARTGRSVPSIQRDLRALWAAGWLLRERRRHDNGLLAGNSYVLIEDPDLPIDPCPAARETAAPADASPVMGPAQEEAARPITSDGSDASPVMGQRKESQLNRENPPTPLPAVREVVAASGDQVVMEVPGLVDGPARAAATDADVQAVFDSWVSSPELIGKRRMVGAVLTPARAQLIRSRLKMGYTAAQLAAAVQGWVYSPHHRGENDRGAIYNTLDVCLSIESPTGAQRRAANLERFAQYVIDPSSRPTGSAEATQAQHARAKREAIDYQRAAERAIEPPRDPDAVRKLAEITASLGGRVPQTTTD